MLMLTIRARYLSRYSLDATILYAHKFVSYNITRSLIRSHHIVDIVLNSSTIIVYFEFQFNDNVFGIEIVLV